jgi:hypothetical protein
VFDVVVVVGASSLRLEPTLLVAFR